jgi:hypothetical protein
MAEAGVGSFDALTAAQMQDFFLDFVAQSIESRVMADLGRRGITLPESVAAVENAQTQLHDFVTGATRGQLAGRLNGLEHLCDQHIITVVDQIYEAAFELVATAGEVDLALLAAAITAADTRISRAADGYDRWTRQIDLHLPVQDAALWTGLAPLITKTLNFLTGDRWAVYFRPRAAGCRELANGAQQAAHSQPNNDLPFLGRTRQLHRRHKSVGSRTYTPAGQPLLGRYLPPAASHKPLLR